MSTPNLSTHDLHTRHERSFETNRFVYPVLSRRAGGLSIGVNLNPDKICNFDCIYCQVNRTQQSETRFVETGDLLRELEETLDLAASGRIYEIGRFRDTPPALRVLRDIAFSGDGEPTTYRNFEELIAACAAVKRRFENAPRSGGVSPPSENPTSGGPSGLPPPVRMTLITNASMFHRPHVQRGLEILDANHGEIWAKLEAGTEEYFRLVDRTPIPFRRILDNITQAAQARAIVIQSLFMRVAGDPPSPAELEAFCDRLNEIVAAGGRIKLVQVYTVARQPAESYVAPLSSAEVDAIADLVRRRTHLAAAPFYGK